MPRHPSTVQSATSRRNGGQSQGPHDTSRTRYNATTHGLFSQALVFRSPEEQAQYQALRADLVAEWAPATPTEGLLIEQLAASTHRLAQVVRMQTQWAVQYESPLSWEATKALPEEEQVRRGQTSRTPVETLLRYERLLQRQWQTALATLRELQRERWAAVAEAAPTGPVGGPSGGDSAAPTALVGGPSGGDSERPAEAGPPSPPMAPPTTAEAELPSPPMAPPTTAEGELPSPPMAPPTTAADRAAAGQNEPKRPSRFVRRNRAPQPPDLPAAEVEDALREQVGQALRQIAAGRQGK